MIVATLSNIRLKAVQNLDMGKNIFLDTHLSNIAYRNEYDFYLIDEKNQYW